MSAVVAVGIILFRTIFLRLNGILMEQQIKKKAKRSIEFSRYPRRRISLQFMYFGWEFDGLVTQKDTMNTIEEHMLSALLKTKLIEDRKSCNWTRSGRTDKGVSAFRQVAAVTVRSTDITRNDIFWQDESKSKPDLITSSEELPYVKMLNGVLPRTIRVLAIASVGQNFDARHNCLERVYTYTFPRSLTSITRMNSACSKLLGSHDFRNFCCIDNNVNRLNMSYIREIKSALIEPFSQTNGDDPFNLLRLTIKASGFLWHQIRCIVGLIYEVGLGNEDPEIIAHLLDTDKYPARPQYNLANELPLCFFDCSYPEGELEWEFETEVLLSVMEFLQKSWAEYQVKASMVFSMINGLSSILPELNTYVKGLERFVQPHPSKKYIPLSKRPTCVSLEERREKRANNLNK